MTQILEKIASFSFSNDIIRPIYFCINQSEGLVAGIKLPFRACVQYFSSRSADWLQRHFGDAAFGKDSSWNGDRLVILITVGTCSEINATQRQVDSGESPPPPPGGRLVLLRLSVFSKSSVRTKKCLALGRLKSGGRSIVVLVGHRLQHSARWSTRLIVRRPRGLKPAYFHLILFPTFLKQRSVLNLVFHAQDG